MKSKLQVTTYTCLQSTRPEVTDLAAVFAKIKTDPVLRWQTEQHRKGEPQKQKVPTFIPSAILEGGRKLEHIQRLTGLIYFDYDHIPEAQIELLTDVLRMNGNVLGYHRSLSGQGLHVIVAYQVFYHDMQPLDLSELDFKDPAKAQRTRLLWNAIWEEVRRQFEESVHAMKFLKDFLIDTQCKDAARPSAMAYDPEAELFEDCYHPYTVILSKALLDYTGSKPHVTTNKPVGRPVRTQTSRAFDAAEAFARLQGLENRHGQLNKFLSTVIYEVNRYGIEEEQVLAEAKERYYYYGDGEKGITSVVRSIYKGHSAEFGSRSLPGRSASTTEHSRKVKRATSADIEHFLLTQGEYRKNVISHRLEVRWNVGSQMAEYHQRSLAAYSLTPVETTDDQPFIELHDADVSTLMRLMFEETGLTVNTPAEMYNVLQSDTCSQPYNPILSYLQPLQGKWKPGDKDYLHELIQTVELEGGEEESTLLDDFFKRWFVGMVHGWIHMSSTHGTILTFIGSQGIGKSSWMRMLLPPALRAYYKEQMRFRNLDKDDRIQLSECALINLEEIDAMSDSDVNQLKSLVTLDRIRERLPYGKSPVTLPRIVTFCATGNRGDFLTDPTGNRRWLTFTVRRFTVNPFDYRPEYEGIYSQALYLAQHQADIFVMNQKDIHHLNAHNEQYVSQSVEVEMSTIYLHHGELDLQSRPTDGSQWLTASEIQARLAYFNPSAKLSIRNLAITLKQQGYRIRTYRGVKQYLVTVLS